MNRKSVDYAVLCSVLVIILAVFYLLSRVGLPDKHFSQVIVFVGISFLILNLPSFIRKKIDHRLNDNESAVWFNELLLAIYIIVVLLLISYINTAIFGFIFVVAGFFFFCLNLLQTIKQPFPGFLFYLFMMVIFSVWVASVCWQGDYLSPLFIESLELAKQNGSSNDPLFHISIAQILKHYNTISNGLNGLNNVKYHFLSHFLHARFSSLLDVHMVYTYNIGYVIIFPPLLLQFFLIVTDRLEVFFQVPAKNDKLVFTLLIIGLTSFIPAYIFNNVAARVVISHNALFISESYLLSILLLLCVIYVFLQLQLTGKHIRYALLIFLPLSVAMVILAKVSTGYILAVVTAYLFLRLGLYKNIIAWIGVGIFSIVGLLIANSVVDKGAADTTFQFMSFFIIEIQARFSLFLTLFYFWAYCACIGIVVHYYIEKKKKKDVDMEKASIMIELIVVVAIAGFIPPALMKIFGGSGLYFLEVQRWIALIVFAAIVPLLLDYAKSPAWIVKCIQGVLIAILCFNTMVALSKAIKNNVLCRTYYVKPSNVTALATMDSRNLSWDKNFYKEMISPQLVDSFYYKLSKDEIYVALTGLMQMDQKSHDDKLIYIKDYNLFHKQISCYHYFYFIPALTGFAAFQGLDYWCVGQSYFLDKGDVTRTPFNQQEFCTTMKKDGIEAFYSYDLNSGKYELMECN